MNRFFASTLVATGAAALFACKSTVSLNTGGSTATSTNATVTAATGTTATGTTNTTGALVGSTTGSGGTQKCQTLCDVNAQLSSQLNCTPVSQPQCMNQCQMLYAMAPQCTPQINDLIDCAKQEASPSTCMCNPQSNDQLSCPNICPQQTNAVSMCFSMGSTGSGMTAVASSSAGGGGGG